MKVDINNNKFRIRPKGINKKNGLILRPNSECKNVNEYGCVLIMLNNIVLKSF